MERIPPIIHESWHPYLQRLFDDRKMIMLRDEVLPKYKFYPKAEDIFKVFSMPLDKIKVVIIGQDPYPNGEAMGYSFAVERTKPIPASLAIIKNEIIKSGVERDTYINIDSSRWKELNHWVQQGVFLLNAALTVEWKNSGSHIGQWSWFTREIIKIISLKNPPKPVWLLWGSKAYSFKQYINSYVKYNPNDANEYQDRVNFGLEAYHPAAEKYADAKGKFTGCNHFNLCNKILRNQNQTIINW